MTNRIELLWKHPEFCLIAGLGTLAVATASLVSVVGAVLSADRTAIVEDRTELVVAEVQISSPALVVAEQPVEKPAEKPVAKAIDPAEAAKAREAFAALLTGVRGAANGFHGVASDVGDSAQATAEAFESITVVAAANRDAAKVAQANRTKELLAKAAHDLKGFGNSFAGRSVSESPKPTTNDDPLARLFAGTARNMEQNRILEERLAARKALLEWLIATAVLNSPTLDVEADKAFPKVPASALASSTDWVTALKAVWDLPASATSLKKAKSGLASSAILYDTVGVKYDAKAVKLSWELKANATGEVTPASVRTLLLDVVNEVIELSGWPAADRKKLLSPEGFVVTFAPPDDHGVATTVMFGCGPCTTVCDVAPVCACMPHPTCAPCGPVCDPCGSDKSTKWVPFSRLRNLFHRSNSCN